MRSQEPLNRPEGPVLPPHLQALVSGGNSGAPPPPPASVAPPAPRPSSVASSAAPPLVAGRPSIANTTNIETLLSALPEVPVPGENVQDKIGFIFNNLSQLNLTQKVRNCRHDSVFSILVSVRLRLRMPHKAYALRCVCPVSCQLTI